MTGVTAHEYENMQAAESEESQYVRGPGSSQQYILRMSDKLGAQRST
jgi:hypothetical protein